ncbi:MAG: metallophosphoesterase [Rubrivivax sp.]|nr:metallophosphoesterase [Rubrivivax sp.]MCL4697036.1 metallophosphoesterase [Burkholderiaceae bacterium]
MTRRPDRPTRLLHVSDPHFGRERPEVVEGLLRLAHTLAPDVLLLSGDLTQRARRAQFAAARRFADAALARSSGATGQPAGALLAVPGNHDVPLFNLPARVAWPYTGFRAAFGPMLEPQWHDDELQLTTLNTTRRWRHIDGELSPQQIDAVASRLRSAAPGQLRVVACHHPLAVPRGGESKNLVKNHERALRCWAEAGADVVLGGHIHLPCVLPMHELMPGLARPLWVVLAGTAVSTRTRHEAGNSVNVLSRVPAEGLLAGRRRCRVERWDWRAATRAFEPAVVHELACQPVAADAADAADAANSSAAPASRSN